MTPSIPLFVERNNVNDETVVLVRWFFGNGEKVDANVLIAEIETSKVNVEVFAPEAGYLVWSFPEGADVPVSAPIGHISSVAPDAVPTLMAASPVESGFAPSPHSNGVRSSAVVDRVQSNGTFHAPAPEFPPSTPYRQRFSMVALKMMETHGLTAADFSGKSAVRKQDVLDFLNPPAAPAKPVAPAVTRAQAGTITQPYKEIALSKIKRREGGSLAAGVGNAIQSAVSVTCFTQGLRRILSTRTAGGSASAVIVFEVSRLLRKYPAFNSTYRNGTMLQYLKVNLGYAMDDGRGLKVAVFQDCDTQSLQHISNQLNDLTVAYIEDRLTPAQVTNATFTISDLSGMGVSSFYPLISENQGAILGVGGEQIFPGDTRGFFTLTLSFDHQLSDGRTAALFLNDLKARLLSYEGATDETQEDMSCSQCGRTAAQLTEANQNLLVSALPKGYLCTYCTAGW
jgi:pyruvate/2-oxoglutarate dehydrogenase complex dihydrolipoamide acyltransferase (E2) component